MTTQHANHQQMWLNRLMGSLDHFKQSFNRVGWFIPPYVSIGYLDKLALLIHDMGDLFSQNELETILAVIYSPDHLAAMALERYPITPYVQEYKLTIAECIEAHFSGLNHIAVSGLMPVIEGSGKKIAESRSLNTAMKTHKMFLSLANSCKEESKSKNIGSSSEIDSMMDSFSEYAEKHLYINSGKYDLDDKTNRHGILHGAYADADFGRPLNFYKAIAAVDFLCFISAFRAAISWFAPGPTEISKRLADLYKQRQIAAAGNPINHLRARDQNQQGSNGL